MDWIMISAIAMVILVLVTGIYAYFTNLLLQKYGEMVEFMRKDRERPQIENLVREVLTPFIEQIDRQNKSLEKEDYGWSHKRKRTEGIFKLRVYGDVKIVFGDLMRKSPNLKYLIEKRNEKCSILQQELRGLDKAIYASSFEEKCLNLVEKYNEGGEFTLSEGWVERSPEFFVDLIINNKKNLDKDNVYYDFWTKNSNELIKIREEKSIKNRIDEIAKISQEIKELSKKLGNELIQLKERFWIEYRLAEREDDFNLIH